MQLHHVCIFASDIDRTVRIYQSAFSARVVHEWQVVYADNGEVFPGRGVFMRLENGTHLEIFPADENATPIEFPTVALNHVAISTDDCDRDFERAVAAGLAPYLPKRAREKGIRWDGTPISMRLGPEGAPTIRIAYLRGPDGEIIELIEATTLQGGQ